MDSRQEWSRRDFMKSVGIAVPTLQQVLDDPVTGAPHDQAAPSPPSPGKFTPVALATCWTASAADIGPKDMMRRAGAPDGLLRTPGGSQVFKGIPFELGPEDPARKSWVVLSRRQVPWAVARLEVPVDTPAAPVSHVCLSAFCDWDPNEDPAATDTITELVGQRLGNLVFVYADGSEQPVPLRRRFEVNSLTVRWGHLPFAAVAHRPERPTTLNQALSDGTQWGTLQQGVWESTYPTGPVSGLPVTVWVSAIISPSPGRPLQALRFEAATDDLLVVCGATLFHGAQNPLRYERLRLYRVTLPEPATEGDERWKASVDLGVIARTYMLHEFDGEQWVASPGPPPGRRLGPVRDSRALYLELTASPEATLSLRDTKGPRSYSWLLGEVNAGGERAANVQEARVEVLEREKTWLNGRVVDAATGRQTPVRLAFRSARGRYLPPYGHRTEINRGWFQDYGADVVLGDDSYAYVDGTFQVELPVGEVYVELSKGFEYEFVRRRLEIAPGQRELELSIGRVADLGSKGWVSADTHVHFLSPSTAVLEGQAEGLNLINLLAAQWGDLFTNVGDLPHGALVSHDGGTIVKVGTENRQHLLGHIAAINRDADPVFPMSASGQNESYIGDPLWNSLAEWADAAHARKGLIVGMHFPYPTAEIAADIVLGKIDAIELEPKVRPDPFGTLVFQDWYRYLNCGYRLPAVGGTDKMSAGIAVGANRTYALLGDRPLSFDNWAAAVKSGNTFVSSGPLLLLTADGRVPGGEILLKSGGGSVAVQAEATCVVPIQRLDIVVNGRAVASRENKEGTRRLSFNETIKLDGPGWIAARCVSSRVLTGFSHSAHTSPVYVTIPGRDLFSPEAAAYMLTLIDGAETWTKNLATRADEARLAKVLAMLADARDRLHKRMHAHGIAH